MSPRRPLILIAFAALLASAEARAHFLFVRIGPMAEAGRSADVYFSEQAEAGDPKFVAKIAHTQLWLQSSPGEFRPLTVRQGADRLRARVPVSGSFSVIGRCEYGVLARPNQTPFLLRYYPKAIAGRPDDLNALRRNREIPLEIMAQIQGDRVRVSLLRDGTPVPQAAFIAVDADLSEDKVTAGADGEATWTPKAPGRYSVYARQDTKADGVVGGKRYEEIREFATIALDWPLVRSGADAEAVSLFEGALAARAQWKDFPGFTAGITGELDGRPFDGKVTVAADGSVALKIDDATAKPWVEGQLESLVMHRLAESHDRPKPVLRFADDRDDHALGRLLHFEGGRFASSYRIKDRQITTVNRHVGGEDMTITTLDQQPNREGAFLPRSYVVQSWDSATGELRRTETVQDRWERVSAFDLPTTHTVTTASDSGLTLRHFMLSDHALTATK